MIKNVVLLLVLSVSFRNSFAQAYYPMPVDSAVWRYRIIDADYVTQVIDNILFLDGQDTIANGLTYHKIISRSAKQTVPVGVTPPLAALDASGPDLFYGAIRESGKQVFLLAGSGEQLLFDFTAVIGDSIPASSGRDKVTAIDSVSLGGVFHKRYLTNDTGYIVIEGVGSNRGLIPDLIDGSGVTTFICLTTSSLIYTPDTTLACTYIYPVGYMSSVREVSNLQQGVSVFPIPAATILHFDVSDELLLSVQVQDCLGRTFWTSRLKGNADVDVSSWPRGIYYIRFGDEVGVRYVKKVLIN